LQIGGQFLAKARRNVFTLFDHHHAFEDLPLQRFLAVVKDHKLRFACIHCQVHRFTLFVSDRHFHLWNICCVYRECTGNECRHSGL